MTFRISFKSGNSMVVSEEVVSSLTNGQSEWIDRYYINSFEFEFIEPIGEIEPKQDSAQDSEWLAPKKTAIIKQ